MASSPYADVAPLILLSVIIVAASYSFCAARNSRKSINPGDPLYDDLLREQWGGPAPKHFRKAWHEWPELHGAEAKGKVALVTGGTGGVGFYVAKLLARIGYVVVLPARSGCEDEAQGSKASILAEVPNATVVVPIEPLDLESLASVRRFAAALAQSPQEGVNRLDLLCLNAGIGGSAADEREATADGLEKIMQVNAISHFLLAVELLPLLLAAPTARIISQTSRQRLCKAPGFSTATRDCKLADLSAQAPSLSGPYNGFHQYQLSKACLCFLTRALNSKFVERASCETVVALVCEPGFAATSVNAQHNLANSLFCVPSWLAPAWLTTRLLHAAGCHASDGALPMVMAATAPQATLHRNDWYTPKSRFAGEPIRGDPTAHSDAHLDPLNEASNWPEGSTELFWQQARSWAPPSPAARLLLNL